jgi:ribonuclease G
MYRQLVINETPHETRVAVMEDGTIVEIFIDRWDTSDITGNIYKGRVQRVLPGMQAAFVDIGLNRAAFIHVNDLVAHGFDDMVADFIPETDRENETDGLNPEEYRALEPVKIVRHIEDIIKEGQEILIHVIKSPLGTKGARVTSYVTLPGRYLVLMPFSDHIGVSRRIVDEKERERLKEVIQNLRENHHGYIVRTVSEGIEEEKLANEMDFLRTLWENIQIKYRNIPSPSILHKELNVSLRAVRDLLTNEAQRLVTDSKEVYDSILGFLDNFMPSLKDSVELYTGNEPIFDAFNLEGDILRALKRKVWLKSGGYIVIEQTEALCAVDVNTGRYVGKHNLEETILKTNLDAVKEIAYQIRLRDIGGLIILDFIDMEKKANQEKVYNALKEALTKDRSKTHVIPMSEVGLIQMTRKRVRQSLNRIMSEPCFYCEGEGYLISMQSICYHIYRQILRESADMIGVKITLRVNPEIAELLLGDENSLIASIEKAIGKQILIYPDTKYHMEEFEIFETLMK